MGGSSNRSELGGYQTTAKKNWFKFHIFFSIAIYGPNTLACLGWDPDELNRGFELLVRDMLQSSVSFSILLYFVSGLLSLSSILKSEKEGEIYFATEMNCTVASSPS